MEAHIIQRAFQLAPRCRTINELRRALHEEGWTAMDPHLNGLGIQRELRKLYNDGSGTMKRGPCRLGDR